MKREIRHADMEPLAPYGRRLAAFVVDVLVVFPFVVVASLFLLAGDPHGGVSTTDVIVFLTLSLAASAYHVVFVALRGQTPGKMATGIRIVRAVDGGPVGWERSATRWAAPTALSLFGLIPGGGGDAAVAIALLTMYLWIVLNEYRQGLHDKAAGTLVVHRGPAEGGSSSPLGSDLARP